MPLETAPSENSNVEILNSERNKLLRATISDLIINGNLEYSLDDSQQISKAADLLPRSIGIYIPSLPGRSYAELLDQLSALKQADRKSVV